MSFSKVTVSLLMVASFCSLAKCQDSATFKGNHFGMTLEDFKQANKGKPAWINTGDPSKRPDKKLSREVETPLCTDQVDGFEGSTPRLPGEVICNVSPGNLNPEARMIAGGEASTLLYHFNNGKLYEVSISVPTIRYFALRNDFDSKYGKPAETAALDCQNGFGARWSAESISWRSGNIEASVVEGCGNGPGQNAFDDLSAAVVVDKSNLPQSPTVKRAADF